MALMSRTHAIRAAFVAGFLLIFLNLIGLRLDVKFDRSPINLSHMSSSLQWPKRTHTSNEINSRTNNYTINDHHTNNDGSYKSSNYKNNSETNVTTYSNSSTTTSNESINSNNRSVEINNRNNNEKGDIKVFSNNSNNNNANKDTIDIVKSNQKEHKEIVNLPRSNNSNHNDEVMAAQSNKSIVDPNDRKMTTIASHHPITKTVVVKKTKYQNFDVDINENSSNLFTSIMKVFGLNPCPPIPPDLVGPIEVDTNVESLEDVEKRLGPKLMAGGRFKPKECKARYRVAIIVPFRDRAKHLPILLKNLHPFLMKQQIDYGIFIVEQNGSGSFNRAKLFNVGFTEASRLYEWDCFIFHDVDLLPLDDRNFYNCPDQPRHMSVAVDTFGFKLPYSSIFGGVSAMTTKQFQTVNGFSNSFWGWGGEDDDMSNRLKHVGFHIARYPVNIARYTMLNHKKEKANPKRYQTLVSGANRYNSDGLNSLKYKVVEVKLKPLYTWIYVDIYGDNTS